MGIEDENENEGVRDARNGDHNMKRRKANKGKAKGKGMRKDGEKGHKGMSKGKMKGRNVAGMGMMMGNKNVAKGMMGMGHKLEADLTEEALRGKSEKKNPVKYVRSLGHNIVTSLTEQTTTALTVSTGAGGADTTDFTVVLAFLCFNDDNTGSYTAADSLGNTYTKLSEVAFNTGYTLVLFHTSGVASIAKNAIVTVTHPASSRRIIMADEFKNVEKTTAADKTAAAYNSVAATFATSGMTATTSQDRELLYGVIGVNGPSTDSFKRPNNWTILHDRGTNAGDSNDIRLVSLFRLTGSTGTYEVSGTLGTARLWASITQTFRAEGGASDVSKD